MSLNKLFFFFKSFLPLKISYGITVCNEVAELTNLLETLLPLIDKKDEVIILQDITVENLEITSILEKYQARIIHIKSKLNGDFASFKNNLITAASKDYLFQIDADEIPKKEFIKNLKKIICKNYKADVFKIPRINIVNGIDQEYISKMNWIENELGYINFPDFQPRIFKLKSKIRWQNKVHEILINGTQEMEINHDNYKNCLLHIKDIKRQKLQNEFYDQL